MLTLALASVAGISLIVALSMTARAARTSATLAEVRSEFVASVTHELKTPIATIRAIGDALASGRIAAQAVHAVRAARHGRSETARAPRQQRPGLVSNHRRRRRVRVRPRIDRRGHR